MYWSISWHGYCQAHFDEGLVARQQAGDMSKGTTKVPRGKLPSDKLTEEELIKFTARINIQVRDCKNMGSVSDVLMMGNEVQWAPSSRQ